MLLMLIAPLALLEHLPVYQACAKHFPGRISPTWMPGCARNAPLLCPPVSEELEKRGLSSV